jgi:glycosyltransferase involved in cell wall biosynthesis
MTLLEALAILRAEGLGFEIDVIGTGSLKGTIQQAAADRGLGPAIRCSNQDFMPQTELRPYFERADRLVMSSIYEAGPVVALEAGVAGVPTVGTRVGHIADMAPAAAIAVPVRDFVALAAGIRELAHDEPKRHRLALEAQGYAIKRDADYTAATFKAIYLELAAGSKRRARRTAQAHEVIGQ